MFSPSRLYWRFLFFFDIKKARRVFSVPTWYLIFLFSGVRLYPVSLNTSFISLFLTFWFFLFICENPLIYQGISRRYLFYRLLMAAPVRLELTTLGLTVRCSTDWAKEQYFRLFLSNNRQKDGKWRCPILPVSVPTSTFGVRKLNFCVRYGNRWNLSAIITTMVIYQTIFGQTYTNYVLKHNVPLLRGHLTVNALPYLPGVSPV